MTVAAPHNAHRPTIAVTRHAIAAGHYLATTAGFDILQAGGNAVDAGVAAGIALGVLQSDLVDVAGVAPIMIYLAEKREVVTIAGLGAWPKALDPELFIKHHGGKIPVGVLRTVVPAAPDAWITALRRYGTMSFGDVASAAARLAREGFPMYPLMAASLQKNAERHAEWPSSAAVFLPNGKPPEVGDVFRQTDLGASLQYMIDEEKAAASRGRDAGLEAARDAFYRGDIARKIVAFMKQEGGLLSAEDLAEYHSPVGPAERRRFGDLDVYTCGAWCQGPVLLQTLALLEGKDLTALGHNSAAYVHHLTEALKLAFADREAYYTDPAKGAVPLPTLISAEYAAERRKRIDPNKAWPEMPPPGPLGAMTPHFAASPPNPHPEPDTSYVCAADRWGNLFSATPSDGSYGSPIVPGTGLIPSNRGSQSRPDPRHPAGVAPGKRPRLTPNPALAIRGGGAQFMPFGTPGGDVQTQAMLQVLLNVFVHGQDVQTAIENPRFASYSYPSSFAPYDYYPGRLNLEGRFPEAVAGDLARRGHKIERWPEWAWLAGAVCAILTDPKRGVMEAGADPRRAAYALGW
ncbi:MAG TPA: gamma-glutamyltransferase family protein [Stellaceae bacterium]|jgi:gamma-glutamyltranspeptidase/glutathione hydrolase|nr:gamma-glutamyltransferase family protein [Stellaceae bacterium]